MLCFEGFPWALGPNAARLQWQGGRTSKAALGWCAGGLFAAPAERTSVPRNGADLAARDPPPAPDSHADAARSPQIGDWDPAGTGIALGLRTLFEGCFSWP